jgi:hypothetical protein
MPDPSGKLTGTSAIPHDDPRRRLVVAQPETGESLLFRLGTR